MNTKTKFAIPLFALVILIPLGLSADATPPQPGDGTVDPIASTTDGYDALESLLKYYENVIPAEDDTEEAQAIETIITRLSAVQAIYQLTHDMEVEEDYADMTIDEMFAVLDSTYGPGDFVDSTTSPAHTHRTPFIEATTRNMVEAHGHGSYDARLTKTHTQTQYDCSDSRNVRGTATSTLTSYTNGDATISTTFTYPEDLDKDIRERRTTTCTDFDHNSTTQRHDILGSWSNTDVRPQVCTITVNNTSETDEVGCNGFGPGAYVFISTHNQYDASQSSRTTQLGPVETSLLIS